MKKCKKTFTIHTSCLGMWILFCLVFIPCFYPERSICTLRRDEKRLLCTMEGSTNNRQFLRNRAEPPGARSLVVSILATIIGMLTTLSLLLVQPKKNWNSPPGYIYLNDTYLNDTMEEESFSSSFSVDWCVSYLYDLYSQPLFILIVVLCKIP